MADPIRRTLLVPFLDDGKIPSRFLPDGGGSGEGIGPRTACTLGTGLAVPSWGLAPSVAMLGTEAHLAGHIEPGATDLIATTVLITAGTFTSGRKCTARTSTGTALLRTTATTIVIDQILSGGSATWVSLDGVVL